MFQYFYICIKYKQMIGVGYISLVICNIIYMNGCENTDSNRNDCKYAYSDDYIPETSGDLAEKLTILSRHISQQFAKIDNCEVFSKLYDKLGNYLDKRIQKNNFVDPMNYVDRDKYAENYVNDRDESSDLCNALCIASNTILNSETENSLARCSVSAAASAADAIAAVIFENKVLSIEASTTLAENAAKNAADAAKKAGYEYKKLSSYFNDFALNCEKIRDIYYK